VTATGSAVVLDGGALTVADVARVARDGASVRVAPAAREKLRAARAVVEGALPSGTAFYGINTGLGSLSRERIPDAALVELQHNLVRSHAAGVGEPLPVPIVRAMLLLLAASLCRGCSGVRDVVVDQLVALLNAAITPIVPSVGSVGASGDLAPLAHLALVVMGEGEADVGGERVDGRAALATAGLTPLSLAPKEGLALVNGTHLMAAEASLLCHDVARLFDAAVIACAMAIDAGKATHTFLDPRLYRVRAQPGPARVASALSRALAGSGIAESHRHDDPRVQDPYSFRCAPLVLGAALDVFEYVHARVSDELAAVTDNPLVFDDGSILSAGNFHGLPVALPLDVLAIALAHMAGIAQQRVFCLLAAREPESGLTPHLSRQPGLSSGLMLAQYTAAACCNELMGLAAPASVANLQTSAGTEDYNSFGPRSAAKARRGVELARYVVAIELLVAAEAIDRHRPLRSGDAVEAAWRHVREEVSPLEHDRPIAPDIERLATLVDRGTFALGSEPL
jgi:histidine ammonia-lyase